MKLTRTVEIEIADNATPDEIRAANAQLNYVVESLQGHAPRAQDVPRRPQNAPMNNQAQRPQNAPQRAENPNGADAMTEPQRKRIYAVGMKVFQQNKTEMFNFIEQTGGAPYDALSKQQASHVIEKLDEMQNADAARHGDDSYFQQ